ncbi:hypothetical protein EGW08_002908, partial [Elysia chlorotica]
EFPRERLKLLEVIGKGKFGQVWSAEVLNIIGTGQWELVAVKMCKETSTDVEKMDFLNEVALVSEIPKHLNVVNYLGCCTAIEPSLLIMEYITGGDLLRFLRKHRKFDLYADQPNVDTRSELILSAETAEVRHANTANWAKMAREMSFVNLSFQPDDLSMEVCLKHRITLQIIHRDLAARNVLVSDRGVCKITDFGLARSTDESDTYERTSKGALPIRWMSPEALTDGCYSSKSDVWAYGVLLWEIVTLGASPYPGLSARDVFRFVNSGSTMDRPDHCSSDLYKLMKECWAYKPQQRLDFVHVCCCLEELLEREEDYIMLDQFQSEHYTYIDPLQLDEKLMFKRHRVVGFVQLGSVRKCLYFTHTKLDWHSAARSCANIGARLYTARSERELLHEIDIPYASRHEDYWIGLNDIETEGNFQWGQDSEVTLINEVKEHPEAFYPWKQGQPDDLEEKDCVLKGRDGLWTVEQCNKQYRFICEEMAASELKQLREFRKSIIFF